MAWCRGLEVTFSSQSWRPGLNPILVSFSSGIIILKKEETLLVYFPLLAFQQQQQQVNKRPEL